MKLDICYIDAFTKVPFHGNTAAVVPLAAWLPETTMQAIAAENNLSETAFFLTGAQEKIAIRWFSPLTEIDFCGHATLASAYLLFQQNPSWTQLSFWADAVGELLVRRQPDGALQMAFPNRAPKPVETIPPALLAGLSEPPRAVYRNVQAYVALYDEEETIRRLKIQHAPLKTLAPYDVAVTAPGKESDFVSRYFWPANGGDEDPVTGSIHAALTPFWAERLGKTQLVARQLSARGGILYCALEGDRVLVSGHAVEYLRGTITV
ncbi:MAG: PhzF family phenazine biosynthesis protein [Paludibacterium sp.]|uniref:PhzF family phenazine biosynthesis protein n=1 Tax=Paludibacterium sp. TaxID=1917523 RepID=UPI0025F627A0|nr:PhzF family phenazine biosynthesis protein [Paludibacterium sp.]MBV8048187.1 PhzF family phenazine biosynthesis protein [Paludibacterium sp.]MBV8645903.1 PhzF family phenazine biosynthesis protein [Paludibacterium sp.]